ncbi:hypothetical protein [Streptomyces sp. NPDC001100]
MRGCGNTSTGTGGSTSGTTGSTSGGVTGSTTGGTTGSLASTGSDISATALGAAGAGVVFAMRRRRTETTQA